MVQFCRGTYGSPYDPLPFLRWIIFNSNKISNENIQQKYPTKIPNKNIQQKYPMRTSNNYSQNKKGRGS
jgi:hypothetical protein